MTAERVDDAENERNWMLLLDEEWTDSDGEAADATAMPPAEAIVGGWLVERDGTIARFTANPLYQPKSPAAPTSPVDATAALVASGRAGVEAVLLALRDSFVEVAVDGEGGVIVAPAPDGVPCVLVASGAVDQARVDAADWRQVDVGGLLTLVPDGVDVLLNPGGPRAMRLFADALRDLAAEDVPQSDEPWPFTP
ncbi:type VII secretion system-associated protein [Micromonospora sp. CA-246542]|uniref:type VII secretion system-associated protein n=1 Tax=Micromonospora sp. CA-246542 TaxID=3239959 RepID=UPI003D91C877